MEGSILSICIIAAIALAVFLGYKTKINTGFFCIVFAYVIGCFVMGLKPKALIGYWPTNTMFVILAVSLFYNVAAANGTLEKIPEPAVCLPEVPGPAALRPVFRSRDPVRHGRCLLHRAGLPGPHHPAHLRGGPDG